MRNLISRIKTGVVYIFLLLNLNSCIAIWEYLNQVTLKQIKSKGTLEVYTAYNPNSYFLYKDKKMGYEYEILELFAKELGVKLEIIPVQDPSTLENMLNSGKGDLIAANVIVTKEKEKSQIFSEHLGTTRLVLVQKKEGKHKQIKTTLDLIGEKVFVRDESDAYDRLKKLEGEIGGKIGIEKLPDDTLTDELIEKVYSGEIPRTVADEPTAMIYKTYYPGLDISIPISFPQKISWIVRKNSPELLATLNAWLVKMKQEGKIDEIRNKYYSKVRIVEPGNIIKIDKRKKKLSIYDSIIKREAEKINWDWLLLASLIYQESRFNPNAKSWSGAMGLMQLMPETGESLGLEDNEFFDPSKNISAGAKHIQWLTNFWKMIPSKDERLHFVLASYNAGHGHVIDARVLAAKFGKNADKWENNTDAMILRLSEPKFYNQSGVKYGYCRGLEPYKYVKEIMERYREWKG